MPKKIILSIKIKDYDDTLICDSLAHGVDIINGLKPIQYRDMTISNLSNILRDTIITPSYIEDITSYNYNEYVRPYFLELFPEKEYITNKGSLSKYYKITIDYILEEQTNDL